MGKLKIELITPKYEKEARQLLLNGYLERYGFLEHSLNNDLENICDSYIKQGHYFFIGIYNNKVACSGALTRYPNHIGKVTRVSVDPHHRRKGFAKEMMQKIEVTASKLGMTKLFLATDMEWQSAICLYKGLGYTEENRDKDFVYLYKKLLKVKELLV